MNQRPKKALPRLDIKSGINHSPHIVILGAGASRACCPNGDRNGRSLPVMSDLVSKLGIVKLIEDAGYDPAGNFEAIYSAIHADQNLDTLRRINEAVGQYFSALELPNDPTFYDYLILSLRPKDMIVTFNWDPLLCQAYRRWRHLGPILPQLVFLHGNVDISIDVVGRRSKFTSDLTGNDEAFKPSQLLYPVEKKDYNSDPFTKAQWDDCLFHLQHAYFVTVYGYSAPKTDVEARGLLLKAWRDNPTQTLAELDVVDIADKRFVEDSWSDFFDGTHGGVSQIFTHNILMRHPRRSCEAFAFATLQQDPWHEDPFPHVSTLKELEEWVRPLLVEEKSQSLSGKPHHTVVTD